MMPSLISSERMLLTSQHQKKDGKRRSILSLVLLLAIISQSNHHAEAKKSIPQSKQSFLYTTHPAWNQSPQIDSHGFLSKKYKLHPGSWEREARIGGKYGYRSHHTRKLPEVECVVRQVPGDGNCLFHSISTALSWVENRKHLDFDETFKKKTIKFSRAGSRFALEDELDLHTRSMILRQIAVDMLDPRNSEDLFEQGPKLFTRKTRRPLFLQGSEFLRSNELLDIACSQYGLTAEEYCDSMRKDGVWGGGPDLVALSNYLRRPIHIFELMTFNPKSRQVERRRRKQARSCRGEETSTEEIESEFRLRRMACFGSPKFDYREPLHILSADCRFPDLTPGQQASAGNHFMVIFPERRGNTKSIIVGEKTSNHSQHGVRVRSGGRAEPRSECTFSKREVISKYLPRDQATPLDPNDCIGIIDRMKKLMNGKNNDESISINIQAKANEYPWAQLKKWCDYRCEALKVAFQE